MRNAKVEVRITRGRSSKGEGRSVNYEGSKFEVRITNLYLIPHNIIQILS